MKMTTRPGIITETPPQAHGLPREVWGVIGGMGPLASAEFMKTIYELGDKHHEQDTPVVMLVSDPTVPDRTECFLNNRSHVLLERLESSIRHLDSLKVTNIVVCCLTIHRVLPLLSGGLGRKVLSLVDLVLCAVIESKRRHLLLCTSGSRAMRLFESHDLWKQARKYVAMPSPSDQEMVHKLIYRIKGNCQSGSDIEFLRTLAARYQAELLIAGCTELHLLAKRAQVSSDGGIQWLDPLMIAALRIANGRAQMQTSDSLCCAVFPVGHPLRIGY
jgi:aspartate racemase